MKHSITIRHKNIKNKLSSVLKFNSFKLKNKIMFIILPFMVIGLSLLTFMGYALTKQTFLKEYKSSRNQVSIHVTNTIELIDAGFRMLETNIEEEMKKGIIEFKNEFVQAGGNPNKISLEELKAKMGAKYDLAIIDRKTTIIKSTLPEGLNFNFMKFDKKLGEEINKIRLSNDIRHERIRTNVGTGFLSKFSYIPTDDHNFLLELLYSQGGLNSIVSELDPIKITTKLKQINPIVASIRIFDVYGYEYVNNGKNYKPTEESLKIVERAKKQQKFELNDGDKIKSYLFINLNVKKQTMTDNSKIIEITYDNTVMMNELKRVAYITFILSFIVLAIMVLIIVLLSRRITHPLTILTTAVKRVSKGDYNAIVERTSHDEIGALADVFNTMTLKIKENFDKIELQKNELEDYNRNLEKKVENRTIELKMALEESECTKKLLQDSNQQFENLFSNMQEGFAINEIIFNEKGEPEDYKFLDANEAFESITNLKISGIKGRTLKEILSDSDLGEEEEEAKAEAGANAEAAVSLEIETEAKVETKSYWLKKHGNVEMAGDPYNYEYYSHELEKYYSVNVFFPVEGKFAMLFSDITSQVLAKEAIKKEKYILERILEDTLAGYWDWDIVEDREYYSPGFKKMLGYEQDELESSKQTWRKMVFKEDLQVIKENYERHVASLGKYPFYNEVRYQHKNGTTVWGIFTGHVVEWDANNKPMQMVGCHINITDLKNLQKSLNEERELLKATLLSIGDGVISTDIKGSVQMMNHVAEEITGWKQSEAIGKSFEDVYHIVDGFTREKCENIFEKVLRSGQSFEMDTLTILIAKGGVERPIENSAAPIKDENGKINGAVLIFRDCTEKKEKIEKIEYLSLHDQLTGLYNRRFLEEEMKRLDCGRNLPLSIVMLDVNGLKLINDAFGHLVGDRVLQRAAAIMKRECRMDDIVARFGGDEFVMVLPSTSKNDVELMLSRIFTNIENEDICSVNISIAYGCATKNKSNENITDIFKLAEDHMYRRKLSESKSMHYKTIEIILKTLHEKSEREKKHSERVSVLSRLMGTALGFNNEDMNELTTTALMHDIGKIAIDLSILDKPSKLNDSEWVEIQRHPELGYQILRSINEFAKLAEYVLAHHERWDGAGYPRNLRGTEIPLQARIIAVADAYDAMTNDRAYRSSLSKEAAIAEVEKNSGTQFDPQIAKLFVGIIADADIDLGLNTCIDIDLDTYIGGNTKNEIDQE